MGVSVVATVFRNMVGVISIILYFINTVFWVIPIVFLSFFKLIPIKPWRTLLSYLLDGCATSWISVNSIIQNLSTPTHIEITGAQALTLQDWYLVISNHQSWVDILILQRVFNRKIPFLKFFLKKELIWVPFLGLAWWALDFPFMSRHSKSFLAKHPHLKGKDLQTTQKACEKFRNKPVSIMNFVEGTRFNPHKQQRQNSPFTHLLKPKAGGLAFVLSAMGSQLHKLLDVTIHYPQGIPTFWDFVCGKVKSIQVKVEILSVEELLNSDAFAEDYFDNPAQRARFQRWLNEIWLEKDHTIEKLSAGQ